MAGGPESGAIDTLGNVWMWGSTYAVGDGSKGKQKQPAKVDTGKSMLSGTASNVMAA
jgi:hypothetical protein